MSLWILPGRRNSVAMRYKAMLETSLAFSRIHNPRNIEYFWYSLWYQTLSDLVADIPNLVVAPQFPLWDGVSFAPTVPGKGAHGVFVDFAILNLTAVAQTQQSHRYGGWKITAVSVGLLVEVKRFPSRSLEGPDLEDSSSCKTQT